MDSKKVELTSEYLIQNIYSSLDVPRENVELYYKDIVEDFNTCLYQLRINIWGETLDVAEYPATWKDALKLRWFPRWLLKRFPCNFIRLEARALYPKMSFKKQGSKIIIRKHLP